MIPTPEPLEDDFTWVLRKALKAREMAPSLLAELAGASQREVIAFSRGRFSADLARQLAPHLELGPDALAGHPDYHPSPTLPAGLERLAFPFDEGFANAWLISCAEVVVLIDAGTDARTLRERITGIDFLNVLITHPHGDHVGGLSALGGQVHSIYAPPGARIRDAEALECGQSLAFGQLQVLVLDLDGHWPGQLGFLINGLDTPVCAVGDALFAGSLGGTPSGERHAAELALVRSMIESLPPETVLLPGHGPPTTAELELRNNPFLAR